jgi:hypothetical protein
METEHPEGGESPFLVKGDASIADVLSLDEVHDEIQYASCPVDGCGEAILLTELDSHIEMHAAEDQEMDEEFGESESPSRSPKRGAVIEASFDTKLSHALRNLNDDEKPSSDRHSSDRQATAKAVWKSILKMPDTSSKVLVSSASKGSRRRLGV